MGGALGDGMQRAMQRVSGGFYMGAGARAHGEGGVQNSRLDESSTRGFL
jgi:hypothetical protein